MKEANKIEGKFTKQEFTTACRQYLNSNKKLITEYKNIHDVPQADALKGLITQYYNMYYGNNNK